MLFLQEGNFIGLPSFHELDTLPLKMGLDKLFANSYEFGVDSSEVILVLGWAGQ